MQDLNFLGLVELRQERQCTYDGFEFFMSFSRSGKGYYEPRMVLLKKICQEQYDGLKMILQMS
jgi:hypothetical protein